MAIKFANFALLNSINNAMKEEGLDWRLEKIQRGKHMLSHVYLRNSTDTEDIAHTSLYIDTDHNIVYPVIFMVEHRKGILPAELYAAPFLLRGVPAVYIQLEPLLYFGYSCELRHTIHLAVQYPRREYRAVMALRHVDFLQVILGIEYYALVLFYPFDIHFPIR